MVRAKQRFQHGGGLTCIILGEPTDGTVSDILRLLNDPNTREPTNMPIMFLACTDNLTSVDYLNTIDRSAKNVDVCDDFISEQSEIREASGRLFN